MPAANTTTAELAAALHDAVAELRSAADPVRAAFVRNYLKSPFEVLGVTKPAVNATAGAVRRRYPKVAPDTLLPALDRLWASDTHEVKALAIRLSGVYQRSLTEEHVASNFHRWLTECRTWNHTDALSINTVGAITRRERAAYAAIAG